MTPHARRVGVLETIAILAGCTEGSLSSVPVLPDGRRPDVMGFTPTGHALFMGDAKDTETPGCLATQARLLAYLRWMECQVVLRQGGGTFALCCGQSPGATAWLRLLVQLSREAGLRPIVSGTEVFDDEDALAWVTFGISRIA